MDRIIPKINNLKQLEYSGGLKFLFRPGVMVKLLFFRDVGDEKLFFSLPGKMLKKIFGKQGLLKFFIFIFRIAGLFFYLIRKLKQIENFIFLCARAIKKNFDFMLGEAGNLIFLFLSWVALGKLKIIPAPGSDTENNFFKGKKYCNINNIKGLQWKT